MFHLFSLSSVNITIYWGVSSYPDMYAGNWMSTLPFTTSNKGWYENH